MNSAWLPSVVAVLDAVGTFAFALSGAMLGIKKQFDLFGVLFLAFVVSVVGGMMRDVLIGAVPPAAITQVHYFLIAMIGGLITFFFSKHIANLQRPILLVDAVGLGLFAVVGAEKAIEHGINPLMAAILGMLTGIGGGMTRDVLAGDDIGLLAQDVERVVPEVVHDGPDGYKHIRYQQLTALLIEAVREQDAVVGALAARVAALQAPQSS